MATLQVKRQPAPYNLVDYHSGELIVRAGEAITPAHFDRFVSMIESVDESGTSVHHSRGNYTVTWFTIEQGLEVASFVVHYRGFDGLPLYAQVVSGGKVVYNPDVYQEVV